MEKNSIETFRHDGGASCHNAFKQKTKTKQNEIHEKKLAQNNFSFPFENIKNHNKRIVKCSSHKVCTYKNRNLHATQTNDIRLFMLFEKRDLFLFATLQ